MNPPIAPHPYPGSVYDGAELRPFTGRPGCNDHMQFGSLNPDGTTRPYAKPVHGCVGSLKQSASQGRD